MSPSMRHLFVAVTLTATACSGGGSEDTTTPIASATTGADTATVAPPTTIRTTTTTLPPATTTTPPTTTPPTTTPPATTTTPPTTTPAADVVQTLEIGRSVEGRSITAVERGTPGGLPVLIIGVIHGNESAGVAVVRDLATMSVPNGVDLWLVESMNPDGQAADQRTNANLVDLNRNFPHRWAPLGIAGDGQYSGPAPASEPETQAIVALVERLQPELLIWYHQDLFRIAPGTGRAGEIRARYAELTGLPMDTITGGTYTGTAASWARNQLPGGVPFIVELGPTLSETEARTHAEAVLTIAADL